MTDPEAHPSESSTELPIDPEIEAPTESPATWENVVVGKATEVLGRALHNHAAVEEGEEQAEIAHEVREEYQDEHHDEHHDEHQGHRGNHGSPPQT